MVMRWKCRIAVAGRTVTTMESVDGKEYASCMHENFLS